MPTLVLKPWNGRQHISIVQEDGTRAMARPPIEGERRVQITLVEAMFDLDQLRAKYFPQPPEPPVFYGS